MGGYYQVAAADSRAQVLFRDENVLCKLKYWLIISLSAMNESDDNNV